VQNLEKEHVLQLAIYMYMNKNEFLEIKKEKIMLKFNALMRSSIVIVGCFFLFYGWIDLVIYCWGFLISVSFAICMLTLLLMPLAGLLFCVGLDFVTPSL
jgi:hypothetical protein